MPPDPPDGERDCAHHCDQDGMIRWHQPRPDGRGGTELAVMELPCPAGHAESWRYPAAERDRVINPGDTLRLPGATDAVNVLPEGLAELITDIYRRAAKNE
ncbi:hypothetical protein JOD54_005345 [Actinokineospora baliensis]|uniref:hypothetical protein n=1 Tax=Actinokineospora baliensis TaxID=547056 RepID=UPI00195DF47C|nr:hypothetical protein [Actinokineospora baliensis]MBM7775141.1 hypothetical protein [Actinokineospora baliensis]